MKISKTTIILILIAAALTAAICYTLAVSPAPTSLIAKPATKSFARLLFVGDLMFDRGIRYYAQKGGGNNFIFEKISPILKANDLVIANLEGPITDNPSISAGTAPGSANNYFFTFDPSVADALFEQNIKIVSLGNNHILNFGREGLKSTKKYLDDANVSYFGAPDYPKSVSTEIKGVKITLINYNEFANLPEGVEQKSTIEEIVKAREYSDLIIIFSHWGAEYEIKPADITRGLAHQFIDTGADLVVGAHPHVVQPMEIYKEKRIYYSLGNFIFDQYFGEDVRNGLGVKVKIDKKTKKLEFDEVNFYLQNNGQTILK